jgi:hypothetical protein
MNVMGTNDKMRSVVTLMVLFAMIFAVMISRGMHVTLPGLTNADGSQYMLKGRHCRKGKRVCARSVRNSRAVILCRKMRQVRPGLRRRRRRATESLTRVRDQYQMIWMMKTRRRMVRRSDGETNSERRPKPWEQAMHSMR